MGLQTSHFRWMEVQVWGDTFLIRPRSNGDFYVDPVDYQFKTADDAWDWRNAELEDFEDDPGEIEYINSWILVTVNTVIDDESFEA